MKTLYLVRHAKSDWSNDNLPDFERFLNKRGVENAQEMAERFSNYQQIPELLISSPAIRALTTAKIFAKVFEISHNLIEKEPDIYESEISDLLRIVNSQSNHVNSIMMFGHNPTLFDFVNYFDDFSIHSFPTCSIAKIEFNVDQWELISKDSGKLVYFDFPKNKALKN